MTDIQMGDRAELHPAELRSKGKVWEFESNEIPADYDGRLKFELGDLPAGTLVEVEKFRKEVVGVGTDPKNPDDSHDGWVPYRSLITEKDGPVVIGTFEQAGRTFRFRVWPSADVTAAVSVEYGVTK